MGHRYIRLFALLLSVAAHTGLWYSIGARGPARGEPASAIPGQIAKESAIVVELRSSTRDSRSAQHSKPAQLSHHENAPTEVSPESGAGAIIQPAQQPFLSVASLVEPHYFRSSELTQKPMVVRDIPRDMMLVLPELPQRAAVLRLFISDQGEIDKLVIEDSHLPEAAEQKVEEAFSRMKFQPGRIGRIAVRSQLRIEIRTEDFFLHAPDTRTPPEAEDVFFNAN